jgi:hypothetical protein
LAREGRERTPHLLAKPAEALPLAASAAERRRRHHQCEDLTGAPQIEVAVLGVRRRDVDEDLRALERLLGVHAHRLSHGRLTSPPPVLAQLSPMTATTTARPRRQPGAHVEHWSANERALFMASGAGLRVGEVATLAHTALDAARLPAQLSFRAACAAVRLDEPSAP